MAKYEYDLSNNSDFRALLEYYDNIGETFTSKKFFKYLADKCMKELEKIQSQNLNVDEDDIYIHRYRYNHKLTFEKDGFVISNDTHLDQSEMYWVSPETVINYPDGISIAYIVEFGTGIKGTSQDDWQVDVKGHGEKGWVYYNISVGAPRWTNGMEGRFIYQKLRDKIEEKASDWIVDYFEKEVK